MSLFWTFYTGFCVDCAWENIPLGWDCVGFKSSTFWSKVIIGEAFGWTLGTAEDPNKPPEFALPPKPKFKSIGFGYCLTIFVEFSVVVLNILFC